MIRPGIWCVCICIMCLVLLSGVASADSTSIMSKEIIVTGTPPGPVANFLGTPISGTAPLTVAFTDQSTGPPTSWNWSFGDGGTSSLQNPTHVYTTVGTYTVSLTATNATGSNLMTRSNYITVTDITTAPTVTSITPATGQNTTTMSITNLAGTGFITGATVNLTKSDQANIVATEVTVVSATRITCKVDLNKKTAGTWNVVVTNPNGQTGMLTNGFTVTRPVPVASFNYNPTTIKINDVVSFDASASTDQYGTITKYDWNFGDNTITSSLTPTITHIYTQSQVYNVTLTVTNDASLTNLTMQQLGVIAKTVTSNTNITGTTVINNAGTQTIQVNETNTQGTVTVSTATNSVVINNPGNGWSQVSYVSSVPITTTSSGDLNLASILNVTMVTEPVPTVLNQSTIGTVSPTVTIPMKQSLTDVTITQSITEGVTTTVANAFQLAAKAVDNNLNVNAVAYTVQFQNTAAIDANLVGSTDPVKINMSISHSWVVANGQGDRNNIKIMRLADDGTKEMLTTRYLGSTSDGITDFFQADSPNGLSTFGIASVSGSTGSSSTSSTAAPVSGIVAVAPKPVQYGQYGQGLATANPAPADKTVVYAFGNPSTTYPVSTQTVSFVPIEAVPQSQCVVQQESPPSEIALTGRPAAYYSITSTISPNDIASGTIHFSVLGSWLSEKQIDPANVVLLRNHDLVWTELPTSFDHTDGDNYYYYSDTPGFSYFAVSDGHPTPAKVTSQTTVSLAEKGGSTSPPVTGTEITTPGMTKPAPESIIPPVSTIPVHDNTLYIAGIILICAGGAIYLSIQKIPRKTRVLIVDDEPQICEILSLMLREKKYKTMKASSGEECLSLLKDKKNHPDAILLDITMYPMDGWKTLDKLKKDPTLQSIPVLMLTGKQLTPEEAKRFGIYIEDYINKPVLAHELYGAIEYVLNRKKKIAGEIQMAIKAGNDKTLVCEYAKLAKQTDVEKKLLEHIRTTYTGVGTTTQEIRGSIEDLTNEVQRREETMIQLRQRLSGFPISNPASIENVE